MKDKVKKNMQDKKWKSLEARGLKRPKNPEENQKRIRAAHVGDD